MSMFGFSLVPGRIDEGVAHVTNVLNVGTARESAPPASGAPVVMPKTIRVHNSYPVQVNDLPIPASRKLSAVFLKLIPTFELRGVKPYDPRYLVNFPAELYDIPMAEASLDARAQTLSHYKRDLPNLLTPVQLISTSSAKMTVDSFRLNLLPVWMTELSFHGREHLVLVNGQDGTVASDLPEKKKEGNRLMDWLKDLIEE